MRHGALGRWGVGAAWGVVLAASTPAPTAEKHEVQHTEAACISVQGLTQTLSTRRVRCCRKNQLVTDGQASQWGELPVGYVRKQPPRIAHYPSTRSPSAQQAICFGVLRDLVSCC